MAGSLHAVMQANGSNAVQQNTLCQSCTPPSSGRCGAPPLRSL